MSKMDSIATFDATVEEQIRTLYNGRCVFCLSKTSVQGSHCAHILDASGEGASQMSIYSKLGIIPEDYERQSKGNGIVLCASCHQGLFSFDYIAFSPPEEVLRYLVDYVTNTPDENQLPLYKVFHGLEVETSDPQGLRIPDPTNILPYIGLYTIIHLKHNEMREFTHSSPFFPRLSQLRNGRWENAPDGIGSTAPNVARIFDALAVNASGQIRTPDVIPLHADHPHYTQNLYWRLPKTSLGGILSAAVLRVTLYSTDSNSKLIRMLENLLSHLTLKKNSRIDAGLSNVAGPSGEAASGPSGEGRRGDEEGGDSEEADELNISF